MTFKLQKLMKSLLLLSLLAVSSPLLAQEQSEVSQKGFSSPNAHRSLAGGWNATITLRVCQTGAAIRSFPSIYAFESGGTMHESSAGAAPLGRTAAYGIWSQLMDQRYYAAYQFFRFNADGTYAGVVKVRKYFLLDFQGFTATGTNEIFDVNGMLIATGCTTETATRFEN